MGRTLVTTSIIIIFALLAFIVGAGTFIGWVMISDASDRRKHYKVTVATKPDGTLGVYKSKSCEMGKKAYTVPGRNDTLLINIDVRLLDGGVTITDMRDAKGLDWT